MVTTRSRATQNVTFSKPMSQIWRFLLVGRTRELRISSNSFAHVARLAEETLPKAKNDSEWIGDTGSYTFLASPLFTPCGFDHCGLHYAIGNLDGSWRTMAGTVQEAKEDADLGDGGVDHGGSNSL